MPINQSAVVVVVKSTEGDCTQLFIQVFQTQISVLNGACCGWGAWDYPDCILHGTSLNHIYNGDNTENCDLGAILVDFKTPITSGVPRLGDNPIHPGALFSAA